MDKDVYDRHYRVVGGLESLETAVKSATCMPCDRATAALLDVARTALNKAVTSAWEYAASNTASATATQEKNSAG